MSDLIQNSYNDLCEAITRGDQMTARNLLLNNADVNILNERDNTPLHRAVINFNDLEIIKMLLDRGANIHAKDYDDNTPLDIAIQRNKTQIASLLIRKGALDEEDLDSFLIKLIEQDNTEIIKIVIDHVMENNPSINLFTSLQDAIFQQNSLIIGTIIPHCGFSKPSDLYIPSDLVIDFDSQSKECVEILLKWNFTIHPESHHDKEFVCAAVINGHLQIVEQLLDLGLDVDMVDTDIGLHILTIASLKNHRKIVKKLVQHNADVNKIFESFNSWLSSIDNEDDLCLTTRLYMCFFADLKTTDLLLKHATKIVDDQKLFILTCMAVLNNEHECIRRLLGQSICVPYVINSEGATFLYQCLDSHFGEPDSRYNIAKLLLEKGASVHLQTPYNTFVFKAILRGHRKIAQLFLDYNANIQYFDSNGDSLIHVAIRQQFDVRFIEDLLKRNLSVNAINLDGQTPLHVACATELHNQLDIIEALLQYNADIHFTDFSLMTPLHYACKVLNLEVIEMLLKKGANPNVINQNGQTPLHIVCQRYSVRASEVIQLLLKHDANIEAMDKDGRTPLFEACSESNRTAIECLLDHHANINHTDKMKLTPLLFIMEYFSDHSVVIETLLEHNANVHCTDMEGNSIIHLIVHTVHDGLIKYFVDTDINFNPINEHGSTPLHLAVEQLNWPMTDILLKHGANINIVNKNNRTPFQEIIVCKFTEDEDVRWVITHLTVDLVKQVIKLKVAGLKVNDDNLDIVYNSDHGIINYNGYPNEKDRLNAIQQFEAECEQEIEKMMTENVGIDSLTFHDLLKENIHLLGRFVDNKTIQQTLEQEVYDKQFPLYVDIVRGRFREARIRHKRYVLMESAREHFRMIINQRLPDECIEMVLNYLNIEELKMFIGAVKLNI